MDPVLSNPLATPAHSIVLYGDNRTRLLTLPLFTNLIEKADAAKSRNLLELVERMLVYKFSSYSRQELEAMFGLTEWQKTRFYQEIEEETKLKVKLETKLETIPKLLSEGLTVEQIARILELDIEVVKTCNQTAK